MKWILAMLVVLGTLAFGSAPAHAHGAVSVCKDAEGTVVVDTIIEDMSSLWVRRSNGHEHVFTFTPRTTYSVKANVNGRVVAARAYRADGTAIGDRPEPDFTLCTPPPTTVVSTTTTTEPTTTTTEATTTTTEPEATTTTAPPTTLASTTTTKASATTVVAAVPTTVAATTTPTTTSQDTTSTSLGRGIVAALPVTGSSGTGPVILFAALLLSMGLAIVRITQWMQSKE